MSGNQADSTWQAERVARYPALFHQEFNGRVTARGYPSVGDGWRDLVETAVGRIASTVAAAPGGIGPDRPNQREIRDLEVYLDSRNGLPEAVSAAIDEAICLAEARSACACETCGEPGRLFKSGSWFSTACNAHGKGKPARERPGLENLHIDSWSRVLKRRVRPADTAGDPPASVRTVATNHYGYWLQMPLRR